MRRKLSRNYRYFVYFLELLILLSALLLFYNFLIPIGKDGKSVYFPDRNRTVVLNTLRKYGYNITDIDTLLLLDKHLPKKGWYTITHTKSGRYAFFHHLADHRANTMWVKVFAGETTEEMLTRLAHDTKRDLQKLKKYYRQKQHLPQGDIFAGKYLIARDADAQAIIDYLFLHSQRKLESFKKQFYCYGLDGEMLKMLITIASIIQKETNDVEEMPMIASVIYNRLHKQMKLQMDSTLNYGSYSHCIVTPERIKYDTSLYNTYKYKGLPPAPLGTVSMEALRAAMFPAKSDYLFFMLTPTGKHTFSKTYEEHLAALKSFREYQKERIKAQQKPRKSKEQNHSLGKVSLPKKAS